MINIKLDLGLLVVHRSGIEVRSLCVLPRLRAGSLFLSPSSETCETRKWPRARAPPSLNLYEKERLLAVYLSPLLAFSFALLSLTKIRDYLRSTGQMCLSWLAKAWFTEESIRLSLMAQVHSTGVPPPSPPVNFFIWTTANAPRWDELARGPSIDWAIEILNLCRLFKSPNFF